MAGTHAASQRPFCRLTPATLERPSYAKTNDLSPSIALVIANELAAHPAAEPTAFWESSPNGDAEPDTQRSGRVIFPMYSMSRWIRIVWHGQM